MNYNSMARMRGALSRKRPQSAVSQNIESLMQEQKAGTGPHIGKSGPLVKNRKQLIAIAYAKARRGERV